MPVVKPSVNKSRNGLPLRGKELAHLDHAPSCTVQYILARSYRDANLYLMPIAGWVWMLGTMVMLALIMSAIAWPSSVFVSFALVVAMALVGFQQDLILESERRRKQAEWLAADIEHLEKALASAEREVSYLKRQAELDTESHRYG